MKYTPPKKTIPSSRARRLGLKALSLFICLATPTVAVAADDIPSHQQLLQKYCVQCHGIQKMKGDVRLDDGSKMTPAIWKNVYEQLAGQTMPPDNKPQPTGTERTHLMKLALNRAQQESAVTSTGFRRLNKREYGNTVRDLLGLRRGTFDPGEYIYADEIDEGFDTDAESLVISNELLLEYMGAAEKSLRQALFSADSQKPASHRRKINLDKVKGTSGRYINHHKEHVIGRSGGKAKLYDGQPSRTMNYPGRYTVTVTASGVDRNFYPIRLQPEKGPLVMGFGVAQDATESVSGKDVLLKTFELQDDTEQTFQFDTWIDKGHFPYLSFVNGPGKPITQIRSNIRRRKLEPSAMKELYRGPGIKITKFEIEGPFHDQWPPESYVTTYDSTTIPRLEDKTEREWLIGRFATRAFRRPVSRQDMAPYFDFLEKKHAANGDWHEAVIRTFAAMMSSPDFLYLRETPGVLDAHALANRLSYFFWSTMPDLELFALAKSGQLTHLSVLTTQVEKMLTDRRSKQFCNSFADQWLALEKLGSMPPDSKGEFRVYYRQNLEPAMIEETRRFFQHVLYENQSVRDFIDSDYSFVNKGLAELYRVPMQSNDASEFQRVIFPASVKRGGLLGHASILTLSANGVETSPIERGVWVLADLLGTPLPPPPKAVPALTPDLNGAVTVREMLEKHRSDPACMECHRRMDPLGFALEAFDPIGRFRTQYSETQTISTDGNYLGKNFADVAELKRILASDIRPFTRNLIIRLAEYAKGRKLDAADYVTVQLLVDQAGENDFKFRDILLSIATSDLMTNR
ncbi:hypothetical protein Poly51_58540 [Rubripirellula tenax]|uniref:Planctomycete cytochrome C n=1 Tax=Rubripirellula tenax TaxID=2528015 RepID=A0A5C6E7K9_9BACT|nr:DUF1592 domain-containing protein [Rubripirellula tenax]TWU44788.1 hypothetical protein Poly51_58540 [Rubripirellula tenax]